MRALRSPRARYAALISADIKAFLSQPHVAALTTVRPDGRPHVTPVWFDFDGGEFTVSTFRGTQKLENVSRKGFAALSIFTQEPPYRNVIIEGTARVGSPIDNVWRERVAVRYLGEHAGPRLRTGDRRLGRHRYPDPASALDIHRLRRELEGVGP